jgi:hypothetical protein
MESLIKLAHKVRELQCVLKVVVGSILNIFRFLVGTAIGESTINEFVL